MMTLTEIFCRHDEREQQQRGHEIHDAHYSTKSPCSNDAAGLGEIKEDLVRDPR